MGMLSTAASYSVCDIEVIHIRILIAVLCAANHVALELKADRDMNLDNGITALANTE